MDSEFSKSGASDGSAVSEARTLCTLVADRDRDRSLGPQEENEYTLGNVKSGLEFGEGPCSSGFPRA